MKTGLTVIFNAEADETQIFLNNERLVFIPGDMRDMNSLHDVLLRVIQKQEMGYA